MPKPTKKSNNNKQRSANSRPLLSVTYSKKKTIKKSGMNKNITYNLRILPKDYSFRLQKADSRKHVSTKSAIRRPAPQSLRVSDNKHSFRLQKIQSKNKPKTNTNPANFGVKFQQIASVAFIIIGLTGTVYFSIQVRKSRNPEQLTTFSLTAPDIQPSRPVKPKDTSLPKSEPNRVTIKSVGIDYGVKPVGKLADGSMETPGVLEEITGWYKYSPTPGEIGPSVIVGHVDSYEGPSVFWRLREVKPGDVVEVVRADGKTASFKITALKQFDQANFPTQEVYGNVDKAELRLITCGGTFNKQTQHYTENTVVFATLMI